MAKGQIAVIFIVTFLIGTVIFLPVGAKVYEIVSGEPAEGIEIKDWRDYIKSPVVFAIAGISGIIFAVIMTMVIGGALGFVAGKRRW